MIQATSPDIIALVNGDQSRTADLVAFLAESKDRVLNEYATSARFAVIFKNNTAD